MKVISEMIKSMDRVSFDIKMGKCMKAAGVVGRKTEKVLL